MDLQSYLSHVRKSLQVPMIALQAMAIAAWIASLLLNPAIAQPFVPMSLSLLIAMVMVCVAKNLTGNNLAWRIGSVLYGGLLALGFRWELESMHDPQAAHFTLPLLILLTLGFAAVAPLRRDYMATTALIWPGLLAGRDAPLPPAMEGPLLGLLLTAIPLLGMCLNHAVAINLRTTFALKERFRALADTDFLTGLPNRRALIQHLEEASASCGASPGFFAMLDLDDFKHINDLHGHAAGDAVLKALADAIRSEVPQFQAGRLGGEEFGLVLYESTTQAARARLEGLLRHVQNGRPSGVAFSFSAGLVRMLPCEGAHLLLRRADAALYAAKRAGKARVVWRDDEQGASTPPLQAVGSL